MATPHVSGVLGLLLSQSRSIGPREAIEFIMDGAKRTDELKGFSQSGRTDAFSMLNNL